MAHLWASALASASCSCSFWARSRASTAEAFSSAAARRSCRRHCTCLPVQREQGSCGGQGPKCWQMIPWTVRLPSLCAPQLHS